MFPDSVFYKENFEYDCTGTTVGFHRVESDLTTFSASLYSSSDKQWRPKLLFMIACHWNFWPMPLGGKALLPGGTRRCEFF